MTERRKLEDIASDLDDVSLSIEEIEEEAAGAAPVKDALEHAREDVERASDIVEDRLPEPPAKP